MASKLASLRLWCLPNTELAILLTFKKCILVSKFLNSCISETIFFYLFPFWCLLRWREKFQLFFFFFFLLQSLISWCICLFVFDQIQHSILGSNNPHLFKLFLIVPELGVSFMALMWVLRMPLCGLAQYHDCEKWTF